MNFRNENINDWIGKIPGNDDKKKIQREFCKLNKK